MFLKILQYSQESTCVRVFLNKVLGLQSCDLLKRASTQVFSSEYYKIFNDISLYRTPLVADASEFLTKLANHFLEGIFSEIS